MSVDPDSNIYKVFVKLLDEGTEVWRPVEAFRVSHNVYQLSGNQPEGEEWQFKVGSIVLCEQKKFTGDVVSGLVAVSAMQQK